MFRRRMAIAVTVIGLGLAAFGGGVAHADGKGVGPSAGVTGQERACAAHTQNEGKSVAKGLECAPPASLVYVLEPWEFDPDFLCIIKFTGSGLAPDSFVMGTEYGEEFAVGIVDASGNTYFEMLFLRDEPDVTTITATAASGEPIVLTINTAC